MTSGVTTRTSTRAHVFRDAFRVGKGEEVFPGGTYDIETRDALMEGDGHTIRVRISTVLIVRARGMIRHCKVGREDLEEAIGLDRGLQLQSVGEVR